MERLYVADVQAWMRGGCTLALMLCHWRFVLRVCFALVCSLACAQDPGRQGLRDTIRAAGATAVVLDVASGRVAKSYGDTGVRALPGSVLKPLVLLTALRAGVVNERTTMHCAGTLRVGGHNLACAHPRDITVLDARQALAESCNTYFAMVAQRLTAETLVSGLRGFGVVPGGLPRTADERVLMALGLEGVTVSPMQLAGAYRELATQINGAAKEIRDQRAESRSGVRVSSTIATLGVVRDGMVQSVQTGMAHAARVDGVEVGGKTGTVDEAGGRSHGWFAGIVFGGDGRARRVVVVFVPNGNGNDAAVMGRRVLAHGVGR